MGSPGPPSEYFHSVPAYEIQSPYRTLYYAAYPQFGYQPEYRSPEDIADVNMLSPSDPVSPSLEYWHYGTRVCYNSELLLNLEIVRPSFCYNCKLIAAFCKEF
jgi:aminopeptidase-like protein